MKNGLEEISMETGRKEELTRVYVIHDAMDQNGGQGNGAKWMNSRHSLEIELISLVNSMSV